MPTPTATIFLPYHALDDVILRGTRAAQPAASAVVPGTLYCVTDEGAKVERSSGTAWQVYSPTPGGGGAGTGDVVGPGVATDQAIALYDGTTGKLIQDSATTIPALTASIESSVTASVIPVDLATETSGTLPDARLSANVQLKPIAATDLPAHHTRHEPGGADALAVDAVAATGSLRTLGTGAQQAAAGTDARLTNARTPTAHATSHSAGNTDPVTVTALAGYPGGTANFLRADGTFAAPAAGAPAAHHATHETGGTDAITSLSGGVITSGTVVDTCLSSNVPLKNAGNVFTVSPQTIQAISPRVALYQVTGATDTHRFDIANIGSALTIQPLTDAGSGIAGAGPVSFNRDGTVLVPQGLSTTPLNATQLTSGTVPDARLSANVQLKPIAATDLPAHHATHETGGADALTALSGGVITSGTVADARLSANVPLKNAANTFTATQTITATRPILTLSDPAGTAQSRLEGHVANQAIYSTNLAFDGTNWLHDDVALAGSMVVVSPGAIAFYTSPAGANPASITSVGVFGAAGVFTIPAGLGTTPLNASNITSGTVPEARLPSTVALIATGSWTPQLTADGGGTPAYATQIGTYVRVGGLYLASFQIALTSKGSLSGFAMLAGFPTAATTTFPYWCPLGWDAIPTIPNLALAIGAGVTPYLRYANTATGAFYGSGLAVTALTNTTQLFGTLIYPAP